MTAARRATTTAAWLVALALVVWWAVRLPLAPAGTPELTDLGGLAGWIPSADPAVVVIGLIRLVVVAVGSWMLLTSTAATVAAIVGNDGALRAVLRVSPAIVRRVVHSTAAITVTATVLAATPAGAAVHGPERRPAAAVVVDAPTTDQVATLHLDDRHVDDRHQHDDPPPGIAEPDELTATMAVVPDRPAPPPATPPEPAVLRLLPAGHDGAAASGAEAPSVDRSAGATDAAEETAITPEQPSTWVVRPGDSFWRITEELRAGRGGATGDIAFLDYWERLIDTNRSELVDRDNPDLLLPGQVLTIPAPTP